MTKQNNNAMSKYKFKIGDKVSYIGKPESFQDALSDLTVLKIAKNGEMLPNGYENNRSNKTLIIVKDTRTGINFWFPEDDLTDQIDTLRKKYEAAQKEYKEALLQITKAAIVSLTKQKDTNSLNVEEFYSNGDYGRICKYCTPKDYPGNYCLSTFKIKEDNLIVTGVDIDDDNECTFYEYDLEAEELAEINCLLENITNAIAAGEYVIDENGDLTAA